MTPVADQKYICCNADEGDSGTFADRMVMEGDPLMLIEGMTIAGLAVGATKGYVYIRSEYPDAIATMNEAIAAAWRPLAWRQYSGYGQILPPRGPPRCRRLYLRRRDRAARKPRGQARHGAASSRRSRRSKACSASPPSSTTC
jgi:hypothetical protein